MPAIVAACCPQLRDSLWAHPDVMPTAEDLDNPDALIARLTGQAAGVVPEPDDMDRALQDLLDGKSFGDAPAEDSGDADGSDDRPVDGDTPV